MKVKGLRWYIIALISLVTVINYIDRNALAIMWIAISRDLGMDKTDYANIVSLFMIAYAISHTVSGRLFDRLGTRMGFVLAILVWSIGCIFHGFVGGVLGFGIARMILGFGEAGNWPGATKSNAEWFPVSERATAQGIFNTGSAVGAIISAPLIVILFLAFSWRSTFIILGISGLLWLIPWLIINKGLPLVHPWVTNEEKKIILGNVKATKNIDEPTSGILKILTIRQCWSIILARFFIDPVWWSFLIWLPVYLTERFGFDIKQIGLFAWVPYVGGAIGGLAGGALAGRLINKGWTIDKTRKTIIIAGGIMMFAPLYFIIYSISPLQAVILIAIVLFGFQFAMTNIQTLISDFFTGKSVGTVMGLSGTASTIGVLLFTQLVPVITRSSYVPFFILIAILIPIGIFCVLIIGKIKTKAIE